MANRNAVEILIRARDGATKTLEEVRDGVKAVGDTARAGLGDLTAYRDELQHQATALEEVARQQDKNSDEYRKTVAELARVKGELKGVNDELKASARDWQRIGQDMVRTGTRLSLGLGAPLALAARSIVNLSRDFEQSMQRVSALAGATGDDLEKLRDQARELGAETQFSASEAADAMSYLAQAGFEVEAIYASMPDTLNLAAAAQLDMGSSADIVSNILTGFNLPVENLGNAVDVLTKAFISSNTDLRQLGEGMKYVGPVASGFGVSIEQTTAALGALSNAGIQGGMAGTTLRGILNGLTREADKLGITTLDAAGNLRPLADIIDDINAKGISTAEVMEIFGDRAGPGMVALLSQGGGSLRDFTRSLEDAGGTAQAVADTQMQGLHGMAKELQSAVEELALALGDAGLLAAVKGVTGALTDFVRWLNEAPPIVKTLALAVGGLGIAAGPVLVGLGTAVQLMPRLISGFRLLRVAMLPLAGPAGLIAGLGVGLSVLLTRWVTADAALKTHKEWIDEAAGAYMQYRGEIYVTTEAERQAAIDRLAVTRAELQERLRLLQELAEQQRTGVQGFLDSPIGRFIMPGWLNVEGSANYGTLEEIERVGEVIATIGSDIEKLASGAERLVEIPPVKIVVEPPPPVDLELNLTGDGADLLTEPETAGADLVTDLAAGVASQEGTWRDTFVGLGELAGTALRNAFGVDQPDSPLVTLGKEIVGAIGEGITSAFPSLQDRLEAGLGAVKDHLASDRELNAWVQSGASLYVPPPTPAMGANVPELRGLPTPAPRDVAGYQANLTQYADALFGPRSAPGRFLADLESMFARAEREAARADRVERSQRSADARAASDYRFGDDANRLAYHNRVIFDPRSGGPVPIALPTPSAVLPGARDLTGFAPGALPMPTVDLTGVTPGSAMMPDRSHLDSDTLDQILAQEMDARAQLVEQLTTMSTENGPLGNFGTQLLNVAAQQVPAFGAALDGFVQAGPVGAVISFFTDLATNSEALRQAFAAINDALAPLGELIGTILAPALQLLGTVIGWVVDALVAIWNFLFGWIPGMRVERQPDDDPPPRTYDHSSTAPTQEMRFGNVSPAVQLAVATPLLEAATLQATAAATLQTAADSLATVYARVESFYTRLLDEGIRVTVDTPTQPAAAANTAYLR